MNKKFFLIIAAFTVTVPGFMLFSYWYLGIFSGVTITPVNEFQMLIYAADHNGDYNKTGEKVVTTRRLLQGFSLPCKPVLIYRDNAIVTGKPNLRSWGGCSTDKNLPVHVIAALQKQGITEKKMHVKNGYAFRTYAQTAVALRKVWPEIARLSDKGVEWNFPLVQLVHEDATNEFLLGVAAK